MIHHLLPPYVIVKTGLEIQLGGKSQKVPIPGVVRTRTPNLQTSHPETGKLPE
jgi:hypothetical protein